VGGRGAQLDVTASPVIPAPLRRCPGLAWRGGGLVVGRRGVPASIGRLGPPMVPPGCTFPRPSGRSSLVVGTQGSRLQPPCLSCRVHIRTSQLFPLPFPSAPPSHDITHHRSPSILDAAHQTRIRQRSSEPPTVSPRTRATVPFLLFVASGEALPWFVARGTSDQHTGASRASLSHTLSGLSASISRHHHPTVHRRDRISISRLASS
jgi:hypothetical protein